MTLLEMLQSYSNTNALPMHMPGHKRNVALAPYLSVLSSDLDITEIHGFGNLHDREGILAERMKQAADLWGSKQAWWLIGGSTAGLLAAIDAATQAGDKVLLGRNCHKSVYNACMLCRLETAYIQPKQFPNHSFFGRICPEDVETALKEHPDTRLVVLTSPTYEGLSSDISAISAIVHAHGAVLLVDEAHGAHFGLKEPFPASAVTLGADMVVQSLHKTLPSLTQTALLHLCSDRVSALELGFRLSVYQTSSPSYLLMASIDSCIELLKEQGNALFESWNKNIHAFYEALSLLHLQIPLHAIPYHDPAKIVISTAGTNLTGPQLAQVLRDTYHFEVEMSTIDTVLCITTMGDTAEDLLRLAHALNEIDQTLLPAAHSVLPIPPFPQQKLPLYEAVTAETEVVPLADSVGKISGDFLWAYPPGIPLIVPGEIITEALISYIHTATSCGIDLSSPKNAQNGYLSVLKGS